MQAYYKKTKNEEYHLVFDRFKDELHSLDKGLALETMLIDFKNKKSLKKLIVSKIEGDISSIDTNLDYIKVSLTERIIRGVTIMGQQQINASSKSRIIAYDGPIQIQI